MKKIPAIRLEISDLWRWDGTIARTPYIFWGSSLLLMKYGIDSAVAHFAFHRSWPIWGYFLPGQAFDFFSMSLADRSFFLTLMLLALPFIWTGTVLTMRRLRGSGMPVFLVKLFFIPFVNLFLFLILSLLPNSDHGTLKKTLTANQESSAALPSPPDKSPPTLPVSADDSWLKQRKNQPLIVTAKKNLSGDAAYALATTVPCSLAIVWLGTVTLQSYGWGLFVGVPFGLGMMSAYLFGRNEAKSFGACVLVAMSAVTVLGLLIFLWAWEGMICIAMASPIAYALAFMGACLGYGMQKRQLTTAEQKLIMTALIFFMPSLMGCEYAVHPQPPLIGVVSTLDIKAPPAVVWKNVIAFPQLPPPEDLMFKLGVAYPVGATICGHGPGAVRRCKFSTGAFVEPIYRWEEPKLLQFGVSAQPPSMRELSWLHEIHPVHLNGYLKVHSGQFKLIPMMKDGQICTRLIGTTWYQNNMWPNGYWRFWSDSIIHKIHMRVLNHIKRQAES